MIANYFKIGLRILHRQRSYTILNVAGLAIGIAVFVFIYLYIQSEIRYDRHWSDNDRIYRIWNEYAIDGKIERVAVTPYLLSGKLQSQFNQQVEASTMIFFTDPSDVNDMSSLTYEDQVFEIPDITLSNESLFNIFDYNLIEGDPKTALFEPNSMVISTEVARQIFGDEPALGKKLRTIIREYTITGVIDKQCRPSHITFDAVVSASSLDPQDIEMMHKDWFWLNCYTYVKLADTVDAKSFEKRFNDFAMAEIEQFIDSAGVSINGYTYYHLEPVSQVHFDTTLGYDSPTNIDYTSLVIFGIIAGFILLTASINYINLAMARSLKRAKEVGVRKVLGAQRKQLTMQHISESFIVTLVAFIIALSLVEFLMPQFNQLIGRDLTLVGTLFTRQGIFFGLGLVLLITLLAIISGIFPAFILSSFNPVYVLKGNNFFFNFRGRKKISAGGIRKVLVTLQYIVSTGMIIATAIIYMQMQFLKKHDLGYDEKNVLVINTPDDTTYYHRSGEFVGELLELPGVVSVSSTMNVPGYTTGKLMFHVGDTSNMSLRTVNYYAVDEHFFDVLGLRLLKGNRFTAEMADDTVRKYIVNEAAMRFLGLDEPVGAKLDATLFARFNGEVIGVVNDFHTVSLHSEIQPLVFLLWPKKSRYILVRSNADMEAKVLDEVKATWTKYNPGNYMHYTYLDEKIKTLYSSDYKMLSLFIYFSLFVIFISSLGLYGLSSFLIEQLIKEIGIRKVLGGSENQITVLLAKDYLKLVLLAGLIATPVVYLLMNNWLDGFAMRITINGWYFVVGILLMLLLAFLTVIVRSYHAVRRSPSAALKYE